MPSSGECFKEFEFDLPCALLRDLTQLLDGMGSASLDKATVEESIPEAQGVYQLFLDDTLVYIGKTDSEAGLRKRLTRHARKIQHREKLDPARVSFKAVRIFVFTAVDLEQQLIKHYSGREDGLAWTNSGFGANDPGRKRDTTKLKENHFDVRYPINIKVGLGATATPGDFTVADVLAKLKEEVPYVVRFENNGRRARMPHVDLETARITIPVGHPTAEDILGLIATALPEWQITVLPGYIIIYREHQNYPHALKWWARGQSGPSATKKPDDAMS